MQDDFNGATLLVTGAASGIGAATARLAAERGVSRLILLDRNADALDRFAKSLPCDVVTMAGDVCDEQLWETADLSGLTHAVVNAGIGAGKPIADCTLADWREVMSVNLDGAFLTLKAAMKAMRAGGKGGSIVLTASVAGVKAEPGIAAYGASKAAVIHLARIAAKEGVPDRIRVNSIAPGGVETAIWSNVPFFTDLVKEKGSEAAAFEAVGAVATPMGRFAKAGEIAEQIPFLLSSRTAFTTGSCLVSDGGYSLSALLPLLLLLGCGSGSEQAAAPEKLPQRACEERDFEGSSFTICRYDPAEHRLELVLEGKDGELLRSFGALEAELGSRASGLLFAMNAGMYDTSGRPIGLYVARGEEEKRLNRNDGPGNFHLKPNGVFAVDAEGRAAVVPSDAWNTEGAEPVWATQSGPMLVIDGKLHPKVDPDGQSLHIRNGVAACGSGTAWFAISNDSVSFGRFARLFRDELGCGNALFLDGAVSSLWEAGIRQDPYPALGPMVAVFEK